MRDPVVAADGNTYERRAITEWILKQGTSPLTRASLTVAQLVPNRNLRHAIESHAASLPSPSTNDGLVATAPPDEDVDVPLMATGSLGLPTRNEHGGFAVECLALSDEILVSITPPTAPAVSKETETSNLPTSSSSPREGRYPVDVCCVIDVSGSMGDAAVLKDANGDSETHGLNLLDIVKHATRTIGSLLTSVDRLSVVTFTDNASVVLPLCAMDEKGKKSLDKACDKMRPLLMTNLWDGLVTGMDVLRTREGADASRNATVLLLTDGVPNVEPPRGHMGSLKRYMAQHWPLTETPPFTVSTFGFGYSLDSDLLHQVARAVGGSFVFIPDSGLVGTAFVNMLANVLCTVGDSVQVWGTSAEATSTTPQFIECDSLLKIVEDGSKVETESNAGTVHIGQDRNISFRVRGPATDCRVRVALRCRGGSLEFLLRPRVASSVAEKAKVRMHVARREFIRRVRQALEGTAVLPASSASLLPLACPPDGNSGAPVTDAAAQQFVSALEADLRGEVALATATKEAFTRWGRHYLLSLIRANELQQCNNFKDQSVQQYGGALFGSLRDAGEAIFTKLPPPKSLATCPQRKSSAAARGGASKGSASKVSSPAQPAATKAPVSMSRYYNRSGGCVLGSSLVDMMDGSRKAARDLVRGDIVANGAMVHLAVEISVDQHLGVHLVQLGSGLWITPHHPVRMTPQRGSWQFPATLAEEHGKQEWFSKSDAPFVYAFVFTGGASYVSHGVEVIGLGHGVEDDVVARHEYLGSSRVVADLELLLECGASDFSIEGRVRIGGLTRDPSTMLVNGLLAFPRSSPSTTAEIDVHA